MRLSLESNARADEGIGLLRGVGAIVAAGILIGVAQNALLRRGETLAGLMDYQRRSLAWVAQKVDAPQLADVQPAAGPEAAAPAALPVIPNLPQPIDMQLSAVKAFVDQDAAAIVDARTREEYAEGHIPGAVNLPFDEAVTDPARLEAFEARGRPIIIYCGGGTCETSRNLAFAMLQVGQKRLLVYTGGYPEWQEAGYPIEVGAEPRVSR